MNTYACWYQGLLGYCFEHPHSGWWFIPEQGQPDSRVHRHLSLQDFIFANRFEWQFENRLQQGRGIKPLWRRCLEALFMPLKPQTVAGLLLLPSLR